MERKAYETYIDVRKYEKKFQTVTQTQTKTI